MKIAYSTLLAAALAAHEASAACELSTATNTGRWDGTGTTGPVQECPSTDPASCNLEDCAAFLTAPGAVRLNSFSFAGPIPKGVGSLGGSLTELHLWQNSLTGEIPSQIGLLTGATGIFLDQNSLSGNIPVEIGDLTEVTWLAMHYNQLTGTIPESITNNVNLERLYMDNNDLTGPIPEAIGDLTNLKDLALWFNQLTGSIPKSFAKLTNLEEFTISQNVDMGNYPIGKEFCEIVQKTDFRCSMTEIVFSACPTDDDCNLVIDNAGHGTDPLDWRCGATCDVTCEYGDWEWDPCDKDDPSEWNDYNPCKNLVCTEAAVFKTGASKWVADSDYELVVLKSGNSRRAHHPHENVDNGAELTHWSGNNIDAVFTCNPSLDCVGDWTEWSDCTNSCGGGKKLRSFNLVTAAQEGGSCPATDCQYDVEECNTEECNLVDCVSFCEAFVSR